jgi:hypothetical protein
MNARAIRKKWKSATRATALDLKSDAIALYDTCS